MKMFLKKIPPELCEGMVCFPQVLIFHQTVELSPRPTGRRVPHIPVDMICHEAILFQRIGF